MSGPKVVRVVTREELIRICERLLKQVDAAQNRWGKLGQRHGVLSEADIAAVKERRQSLQRLLQEERFRDLQKQAPLEVEFLRSDMERIIAQAAGQAAKERTQARRRREAADALVTALESAGKTVPAALASELKRGDAQAMQQAWQLLADAAPASADQTNELAAFYKEGLERRDLAQWLAGQPAQPNDAATSALELKVSELALLNAEAAAGFEARILEVEGVDAARKPLLVDSLNMDLSRALSTARNTARLSGELALLLADLEALDATAASELRVQGAQASNAALPALIQNATAKIEALRMSQAAELQRAAILEGLAKLGYEVTETMSTSWVENGKLVVRNGVRPDYGVELNGDFAAGRAQVRAVAFGDAGATQDPARDRDAETIWCNEVGVLNASLQAAGAKLEIERSVPAGATPLKRVADPQRENRSREGRERQLRQL